MCGRIEVEVMARTKVHSKTDGQTGTSQVNLVEQRVRARSTLELGTRDQLDPLQCAVSPEPLLREPGIQLPHRPLVPGPQRGADVAQTWLGPTTLGVDRKGPVWHPHPTLCPYLSC